MNQPNNGEFPQTTAQVNNAPATPTNTTTDSTFYQLIKRSLILGCFSFVIHVSLLTGMMIQYKDTWLRACDSEYKSWSIGWAVLRIVRSACRVVESSMRLYKVQHGGPANFSPMLYHNPIFELTNLCWFIFGLFINFNETDANASCPGPAKVWSTAVWLLTAVEYFYPCLLIVLISPPILLLSRWSFVRNVIIPLLFGPYGLTGSQRIAPELIDKIETGKFSDFIKDNKLDILSDNKPAAAPVKSNSQNNSSEQAMNLSPSNERVNDDTVIAVNTATCPICYYDFEGDDKVMRLPCNPRLHYFHDRCIREWFEQSVYCPMCRKNIVTFINEGQNIA